MTTDPHTKFGANRLRVSKKKKKSEVLNPATMSLKVATKSFRFTFSVVMTHKQTKFGGKGPAV